MEHNIEITVVSADEFDALQRELDKPAEVNPKLVALFQRQNRFDADDTNHPNA